MANLGEFKISTNGEYVKLDTITGITFAADTKYTMQARNQGSYLTVCIADTQPTDGGFMIEHLEKFDYTPADGYDIYVFTGITGAVYLNIAA